MQQLDPATDLLPALRLLVLRQTTLPNEFHEPAGAADNRRIRRRISMLLIVLGNAGIVTVVSFFIVTLIKTTESEHWVWLLVLLIVGLSLLWISVQSQRLARRICRVVGLPLKHRTTPDARDHVDLLHLGRGY